MRDTNLATRSEAAETDARTAAVLLMTQALALIDRDPTISGIAGAHVQMAIDSLWRNASRDPVSLDLH